jgi:hypothetical protein
MREDAPISGGDAVSQTAIRLRTTILPGHRVEVSSPELPEGRTATVLILLDEPPSDKRPLREVLGDYQGGGLFRTAEEVENYLRAERESWDN